MRVSTGFLGSLAIALGSALTPFVANADPGGALKELSAQWWQWAMSIPVVSNPLFDPTRPGDPTAVNCMVGQRGPVWFLGGAVSAGTIRRTCSVPEGVDLFLPVINAVNVNTPGFCGQSGNLSLAQLRSAAAGFIDAVSVLEAKVDNRPIRNIRRVQSVPFVATLPADNLFVNPCATQIPPGSPAGSYSPAVDDGYYVRIDGLDQGVHTLEFRAKSGTFELDVAYVLTVIPVSREVKH
jgi:hypothetical protein